MLKSLPPWGKVLNKVKRMRGKCAAATRERVVLGSLALISQRAGPLTASPEGEAFLLCKKRILHGVQHGGTACGKVHAALQIAGVGRAQRAVAGNFNRAALGKAA